MSYGLLSCSNKIGIEFFTNNLIRNNYKIIASDGTFNILNKYFKNKIYKTEHLSKMPELIGGKVKTLHPSIFTGILANRGSVEDMNDLKKNNINLIDYVAVNLYPFEKMVYEYYENKKEMKDNHDIDKNIILANIDIGGQSLIRAAAKNYKYVSVIVDPNDYQYFVENFHNLTEKDRKDMAAKAFDYVTEYDMNISEYFNRSKIFYKKHLKLGNLRYGCNPHQKESFITIEKKKNLPFKIINGEPGYNNILDAVTSSQCVTELGKVLGRTVAASFKHTSPAGIGTCREISSILQNSFNINDKHNFYSKSLTAVIRARNSDPLSSFGDFIALNDTVDFATAYLLKNEVSDGIIAPDYTNSALDILKKKKKGKYIILQSNKKYKDAEIEFRELNGVGLFQEKNKYIIDDSLFEGITDKELIEDLKLAYMSLKYIPSNAVTVVQNGQVIGVGCGQQNRLDCIKLATKKANNFLLKKHPKVINLIQHFKKGIKRTNRINCIMQYIEGNLNNDDIFSYKYNEWIKNFVDEYKYSDLTLGEQDNFLYYCNNLVLGSDGFLPFMDNVEECRKNNIKHIIQPGGSIKDEEIINGVKDYDMNMIITGDRLFYH